MEIGHVAVLSPLWGRLRWWWSF